MKLLYFAWVRERIGTAEENLQLPETISNIDELLGWLQGQSEGHAIALADKDRLRIAVNQTYIRGNPTITDSDEIAIFPPVTGG